MDEKAKQNDSESSAMGAARGEQALRLDHLPDEILSKIFKLAGPSTLPAYIMVNAKCFMQGVRLSRSTPEFRTIHLIIDAVIKTKPELSKVFTLTDAELNNLENDRIPSDSLRSSLIPRLFPRVVEQLRAFNETDWAIFISLTEKNAFNEFRQDAQKDPYFNFQYLYPRNAKRQDWLIERLSKVCGPAYPDILVQLAVELSNRKTARAILVHLKQRKMDNKPMDATMDAIYQNLSARFNQNTDPRVAALPQASSSASNANC